MKIYFHGVWRARSAGHHLYAPGGRDVYGADAQALPFHWGELDGTFCPGVCVKGQRVEREAQRQGWAKLTVRSGWTVLAWWDRTGDPRYGCNSAVVAEGNRSFADMILLAAEYFPDQMARQPEPFL